MELHASPSALRDHPTYFRHVPLDHSRPSIRLLRILPALNDYSLVQCELIHGTVEASYVCLSYMWGAADTDRLIKVNGKFFKVRENLWNFLRIVRQLKERSQSTLYWIDALCIDQNNVLERNHQVAQMGVIYHRAQSVCIWLGTADSTERLIQVALEAWKLMARCETLAEFHKLARRDASICNEGVAVDWMHLLTHEYWTRAWITQEVLLSQKTRLSARFGSITIEQLRPICYLERTFVDRFLGTRLVGDYIIRSTRALKYLGYMFSSHKLHEHSMAQLLYEFPYRDCEIPRDRVHSLAYLAQDGAKVPVSYAMSDRKFFHSLLISLRASLTCVCTVAVLADALQYYPQPLEDDCGPAFRLMGGRKKFCGGCRDKSICMKEYCSMLTDWHFKKKNVSADSVYPNRSPLDVGKMQMGISFGPYFPVQDVDAETTCLTLSADELIYFVHFSHGTGQYAGRVTPTLCSRGLDGDGRFEMV